MSEAQPQGSGRRPTHRPGKKSIPWDRDAEILDEVKEVDRRRLGGESIQSIALALGIGLATVKVHIRRASILYRDRTAANVAEQREDVIRRLEEVVRTALGQARFDYEAARAVLFGSVAHGIDGEELTIDPPDVGEGFRGVIKMPEYKGSPSASLAVARQALMDIAKLQGLVVDKVAPTNADGTTLDLASLVLAARKQEPGAPSA